MVLLSSSEYFGQSAHNIKRSLAQISPTYDPYYPSSKVELFVGVQR